MSLPLSRLVPDIVAEQDARLRGWSLSALDLLGSAPGFRSRSRRSLRTLGVFLVGGIVGTVLLVAAALVFPEIEATLVSDGPPEALEVGRWVASASDSPVDVNFSDGVRMAIAPSSRLRVVGLNRRGADLSLETGGISIQVEGSRFTEYHFWVGPFELILPRSDAQISWDPVTLQLDLIVRSGYVVIAGCQFGAGRSVTSGKELATRCFAQ
ncbi:MAG: hypothetical protein QM784_23790 [Polyangiaceae bacterium]